MLSIIVPARNNFDLTSTCLGTLLYSVTRLNLACEFILIDDASPPEERILDAFRQHRANAPGHDHKIVRSRKHQHYSGVFSIGLKLATRDVIFFISNDMFVTPTFVQGLLLISSLSRDFGIVRGTSNHTDSHPEHIVVPEKAPASFQDVDKFSREVFNANSCRFTEDQVLSGDAILLKRALVERIGVLDLRFFGYFGDIDYGMRAHLAGFKLVCAKGAWLYHEGAGHVKREAARGPVPFEELHRRRMADVDVAFQEFRKKWNLASPRTYADVRSLFFFDAARAHADKVALKYDFPPSVMDDIEFH